MKKYLYLLIIILAFILGCETSQQNIKNTPEEKSTTNTNPKTYISRSEYQGRFEYVWLKKRINNPDHFRLQDENNVYLIEKRKKKDSFDETIFNMIDMIILQKNPIE